MGEKEAADYVEKWRKLYEPIEKITGMRCYAFDPDIALCDKGHSITIPIWFCKRLLAEHQLAPAAGKDETG